MNNKTLKNHIIHTALGMFLFLVTFLVPSSVNAIKVGDVKEFSYINNTIQEYKAEVSGYYQLETWGAQGGTANNSSYLGGYGGYSTGVVFLKRGTTIYVVVGGRGTAGVNNTKAGGYNGGGKGQSAYYAAYHASGGGATHIAEKSGLLSELSEDKNSVLIVSGGGGGSWYQTVSYKITTHGGSGGGMVGGSIRGTNGTATNTITTGGTQSSGGTLGSYNSRTTAISGSFGTGGPGNGNCGSGGGGGYYGGAGANCTAGGGGSGYIGSSKLLTYGSYKKAMYCYSCTASNDDSTYTVATSSVSGTATANYAKTGDGYAKIKLLYIASEESRLSNLEVSGGVFDKTFNPNTYEYNVLLDSENYDATITATPMDSKATVIGDGNYKIPAGTTDYPIVVTAEDGTVSTYILHITRPPSSYKYLSDIVVNGQSIEGFVPEKLNYSINVGNSEKVSLEGIYGRPNQTIDGNGEFSVPTGTTIKKIDVTSEDGRYTVTYTITIYREHSSKLKSLNINNHELNPTFDPDTLEYTVEIMSSALSLDVDAVPLDEEAVVTLNGFGYIKTSKVATITVKEPNCSDTIYNIRIQKSGSVEQTSYEFPYNGQIQEFTAPVNGYYQLETWGAQGGTANNSAYIGGYGGYSTGVVSLKQGETVYVVVGGKGTNGVNNSKAGGYNGGGIGQSAYYAAYYASGGGATHIAEQTGLLSTLSDDRDSILIVSGGGGGSWYQTAAYTITTHGGSGGGFVGGTIRGTIKTSTNTFTTGGSQSSGGVMGSFTSKRSNISGSFGLGGNRNGSCGSGGGGGYYGGAGAECTGGGGGSGYIGNSKLLTHKEITKVMYCYSCITSDDDDTYTETTANYSASPTSYYAKSGDGYARITLLAQLSSNNFLTNITTDKGTLSPAFDMERLEYDVELGPEDDEITIGAKLEDDTATVTGTGTFDVPAGTTSFPITVTAEDGSIRIYTVNVTRPASSNAKPINIVISGLVPTLCAMNEDYCKLSDEFSPDIHNYTMTVPSRIKQIQFTVVKGHKYQTVTGEGVVSLQGGMNVFTIEVMSEDGTKVETYTYNIERDMTGNANIESLKVVDPVVNINYNPDITDYYFSIPNEYTKVGLEIVLEDENATHEVFGNENFEVGLNVVTIVVTAQNGETKTYTLNIYREQSGNTFLSDLTVSHEEEIFELNPTFNKIISTYTVNVRNEIDEIEIKATPEHSLTTIKGLGKFTLKTGTNTFQVISIAEDGSIQIYTISVIRDKNSDATLKSLDVLESSLDPTFERNTFEYYLDVNPGITSLHINAVPNNPLATYKITGNSGFKVGVDNIVRITVTAEAGNTNIYTLHVNRLPSTNTNLISLTTDKYDMTHIFNKDITDYDITVENEVDKIRVEAFAEDPLSTVTGAGIYSLQTGVNDISVTVIAEDGSSKTYTLHITRLQNSNANLLSLTTTSQESLMPEFNKDEQNYTLFVENDEKEITVIGTPEVKTSKVTGNGVYQLNVGDNTITIIVEAEDGTTKTYTLTVNRKASSNANIMNIIAKESVLDPLFNKNTTSYLLKVVEEVTSLTLTITLEDPTAKYEVIGNEDFKIGHNTVTIKVTAEDGTEKYYELDVLRQEKGTTSNRLNWLKTDRGELNPSFDPDINYYEIEVPYLVTDITLSGELEDKNAAVKGLTKYQLDVGINILAVEVTSVEGIVRYYQVVVTRKANNEARLSNLQVLSTTLSPNFNKDTYDYTITTMLTELNIIATPLDSNATYEIIGNKDLTLGNNQVIIRVTAQDKVTTKDYVINVIKEKSNNNNLELLEVEGETFTPAFSKTTTVYYLEVERDTEAIQVKAIPEDKNATVEGDGEVYLNVGVNYVEVKVISESGNEKVYTIVVTRKGNDNYYLEDLGVDPGTLTPVFEKTTNDYTVTVPYEVENIEVYGSLEDKNATVVGLDTYPLEVGENTILVTVTAEDGTTNIYTITVVREEIVSSQLEDLKIKDYELSSPFNKDVYDYNVVVDNEVTSLDITTIPIDKGAKVEIEGNENFIVGMNVVKIIVTDRLGKSQSTYILNVNRQNYANTYLAYIYPSVGVLDPTFDKTNLTYTVEVEPDVSSINIAAEPEITTNTLTGTGDYNLENGSITVPLVVTTPTGISRTYYVNVVKKLKENNYLESLVVRANGNVQTLTPSFSRDILSYSVTVAPGTSNISISATAEEGAIITGTGNKSLNLGENNFDIVVTAENGSERIYHLTVYREASTNNFLIDLIPSAGTLEPSFNYTLDEYSIKLDSSVSLLSFEAITEDIYAKVDGIEKEVVPDGESTRKITVTAEDGSKKTYTIHIFKDRTDEARLSNLELAGYKFNEEFDPDTFNYTVKVPNSKSVVLSSEVTAIPMDSNATVSKTSSLVLSSNVINIYTVVVTAKDGFTTQTYTISIEREKGNDSTLIRLEFPSGTLSPIFTPNVHDYTLTVAASATPIKASDVIAIPMDSDANVTMPELFEFNDHGSTYEIVVTSPDGTSKTTYTIHLERLESNDATLKELTVSEGELDPDFAPEKVSYTVNVPDTLEEIDIHAVPNDEHAKIIKGEGIHSLNEYSTVIEITVQAEDGTIKVYTVTVIKSITTQKFLSDLYLEGDCTKETCPLIPEFSEENLNYSTTVDNEIESIDIKYVKKHENQIVKVYKDTIDNEISSENISLKTGKNVFLVEIENGVGEKTTYTITINRKYSSNNYLEYLKVVDPETELDFDKEVTEYFISIPSDYDKVVLDYKPEVDTSTVNVSGTTYLSYGNNDVVITVTAEDMSTRTYILHVERKTKYNNYLASLTVSSGIIYELSPKFNKTTTDYVVTVPYSAQTVKIDAVAEDSTTAVYGTGEKKLDVGVNKHSITTQAATGEILIYNIIINREKSTNLFLERLEINNATMIEDFAKEKFSYTVEADSSVDRLDMIIVPEDKTATYKVVGNNNLMTGENTILIILENQDKTITTTYKLTVYKNISSDNHLKSLMVDDKELITSSTYENTDFSVTVPSDKDIVDIKAIPNVSSSKVTGEGIYSLDYGDNVVKIKVTAEDGSERGYTVTIKREYDLDLLMITTDRGELSPAFDANTTDYYLDVEKEIEDITVIGVASSALTTVTGNGYYTLEVGENLIYLTVSSSDGSSKKYTLHINRKLSDNNYLKKLYVHEGVLQDEFQRENQDYTVEVPYGVTSLTIDAEPEDETASVEIVGNSNLKTGNNTVQIKVTAENKEVRTYTLHVVVQEEAEFSNRLIDLTVNKGTLDPTFNPDTTSYTVTLPNGTKDITVSGILENVDATVTGFGLHQLQSGRNEIPVVVTSKDHKTRTYSIIVIVEESSDARLKLVKFDEAELFPLFDKDVENYQMKIDSSVNSLTEYVEPYVQGTTYEITGNKNIGPGESVITIVATAEDKVTTKTYTFTVSKELSNNNYLESLESNIGTLDPKFEKTNTGPYVIEVNSSVNSIILTGKKEDAKATVEGLGMHELTKGENVILITVTSESGISRVYTVIVRKSLSSENRLASLTTSDGELTPPFDPEETTYTLDLDSDVSEFTVLGVAKDKNATVSGNGKYILDNIGNKIEIIVTAENGSTRTYTIYINRAEEYSSKLLDIRAHEGRLIPEFQKNTFEYIINVPYEVTSLTLDITKEDEEATYVIEGNNNFKVGTNEVRIIVTSKDQSSSTTYILNVIRGQMANNYLKELNISEGTLDPDFAKETIYYEVSVSSNTSSIQVNGIPEDSNATVNGNGRYTLQTGDNYIYIDVISSTGVMRTYTIKVIRELSSMNLLFALDVNPGELSPNFNPAENNYTVELDEGVNEIEITGTADPKASVTGFGTHPVVTGENRYEVVVTAEDGSTNTYVIIANKNASSNTNIMNIIPSSGVLSPDYTDAVDTYEVIVDEDVSIIDFDVILESPSATVEGDKNNYLDYGDNDITITVTAEDGTTKEVHINVIREKLITEIIVDSPLLMEVGDTVEINPIILPEDATDTELIWEVEDPEILELEDGKVTALKIGETVITIASKKNPNVKATIYVNVLNLKITSEVYEVRREDGLYPYIIGAEQGTKLSEFLSNLDNNESLIHFYDAEGVELTELDDEIVKTGELVTLEYNDKVYDQVYIAVRGEANGDGEINVKDYNVALNHTLKKELLENYWFAVTNVEEEEDGIINVKDSNKIQNRILKIIDHMNP